MKIKMVKKVNVTIQDLTGPEETLYVATKKWQYIPSTYVLVMEYNHHAFVVKLSVDSKTSKVVDKQIIKLI